VSPTFYALGRNRVPVIVSMIAVLVNASLNYVLVHTSLGYRGLALGTSIAALFNACTLLYLLRAHLQGLNEMRLLGSIARIGVAAIAMGAAAFWSHEWLVARLPSHTFLNQAIRLGLSIGSSLIVLAAAAWLLRIREFREAVAIVARRLRRPAR